jgi:catalase
VAGLANDGHALEFLKDQYRHCKPILALGAGSSLLEKAGLPGALPTGEPDPGLLAFESYSAQVVEPFVLALASHRVFERETDPPRV